MFNGYRLIIAKHQGLWHVDGPITPTARDGESQDLPLSRGKAAFQRTINAFLAGRETPGDRFMLAADAFGSGEPVLTSV